jgi:hypothetical protein
VPVLPDDDGADRPPTTAEVAAWNAVVPEVNATVTLEPA